MHKCTSFHSYRQVSDSLRRKIYIVCYKKPEQSHFGTRKQASRQLTLKWVPALFHQLSLQNSYSGEKHGWKRTVLITKKTSTGYPCLLSLNRKPRICSMWSQPAALKRRTDQNKLYNGPQRNKIKQKNGENLKQNKTELKQITKALVNVIWEIQMYGNQKTRKGCYETGITAEQ